jgi:hypothetical protein
MKVFSKIPPWQEILPVASSILFIVYTFTIYRMLFQIPSWLYSHTKPDIFFLAVYVFAAAFIESLLVCAFIVALNLITPRWIFRDQFIAQGSLMVIACAIWALILKYQLDISGLRGLRAVLMLVTLFTLSLLIILIVFYFLMKRFPPVKSLLEALADRMIIFAWIYAPVGLVSMVIVLVRKLFN